MYITCIQHVPYDIYTYIMYSLTIVLMEITFHCIFITYLITEYVYVQLFAWFYNPLCVHIYKFMIPVVSFLSSLYDGALFTSSEFIKYSLNILFNKDSFISSSHDCNRHSKHE